MRQLFTCILFLTTLYGCSIKPLYLHSNYTQDALAELVINSGNSIEEAEFYSEITELLPSQRGAKYYLTYSLNYSINNSMILKNSDTIRKQLMLVTNYAVKDDIGNIISKDDFTSFLSYDSGFLPYVTSQFDNRAKLDLAKSAAKEVFFRLQQAKFKPSYPDNIPNTK